MKKISINKKRFKYGTLATVTTVIFIAIVVLVNIVASMLIERFPLKLDLTQNKTFELSKETTDFLKDIDKDVELTVLIDELSLSSDVQSGGKQVYEIIKQYERYSDKITATFYNTAKNPQILSKFSENYSGDVASKLVMVQSGNRVKALAQSDIIKYQQTSYTEYNTSLTAEQALTSAIMNVVDDNPMRATVLSSESAGTDVGSITDLLSTNGYEIDEVDPLSGVIDGNTDLVIINAPVNDYPDEVITKLDNYLDNGGRLGKNIMYIASFQQNPTPNLDAFLADWGIKIGTGTVQDADAKNNFSLSNGVPGLIIYPEKNDYTKNLQNPNLPLIVPMSREIELLYDEKDTRKTTALLSTSDTSYIYPADATTELNIDEVELGKNPLVVLGSKHVYNTEKAENVYSNVLVFGSTMMVGDYFTADSSLNNGDYMLNSVNNITGKGASIIIVPKDLTNTSLNVTVPQAILIRNIVLFIIPAAIIIAGIIVSIRRRKIDERQS
ncbi:MAG: GldG family protein [Oscillospiraceae bacterium]